MEAKECKIQDILTENKKYIIPAYQRPYSWQPEHAEQLIEDIVQSHDSQEKEYFIGSMICISKGDNTYEVVDGQQRLTTLSLVLAQLKNIIKNKGVKDDLQKRILPIDVYADEPHEPRLTVRQKEYNLYTYYILQNNIEYKPAKPSDTETLFIQNNTTIHNYLHEFPDEYLKSLAKYILHNVYIVFVTTQDLASSFRLFNVLNNRGLSLSNADLLKNTLFESASRTNNHLKSNQVENAWLEMEDLIGVSKLDKFLTLNKISEKRDRDRVVKRDYHSYAESLNTEFTGNAVNMSLALLNSAKNYTRIIENDFTDINIKRRIGSLINLSSDEWIPPLMAFLNRMTRKDDLTTANLSNFVTCFEKIYMHGWLKKQIKSQREMVCYSALVAINNKLSFNEIIKNITQHADNKGFINALNENIYEPTPSQVNLTKTILLRIDLEHQDDSVVKTYNGRITIEHILPQKITNTYWLDRFTPSEHAKWLHKLGNLTLISSSKNSEAQHSDFDRKKSIYEKLNQKSSFDITRDICQLEEWNLSNLKERHKSLSETLKHIWLVDNEHLAADLLLAIK